MQIKTRTKNSWLCSYLTNSSQLFLAVYLRRYVPRRVAVLTIQIENFENLKKVSMTKAINKNTPLTLRESKAITDKLLLDGSVKIRVEPSYNLVGLTSDLAMANIRFTLIE